MLLRSGSAVVGLVILCAAALPLCHGITASAAFQPVLKHEVTSLPGFDDRLPSRHYTGHVPVNDGQHQLFYWLVESEYSAEDDPVLLWLTGGPGCSSLDAFIYEHGPFNFEFIQDGKAKEGNKQGIRLTPNPWSWSKAATIIYVDSPVCVGMSYSTKEEDVETDDQQTTDELLEFITSLLTDIHPRLQSKDFYIAGESYAGVYVPLLASKVMKRNQLVSGDQRINLQGYAVGNGVTDDMYDGNGQPEFAFNLGLLDPATYVHLIDVCGGSNRFWNATPDGPCDKQLRAAYARFYWLNPYDILQDCFSPRNEDSIADPLDTSRSTNDASQTQQHISRSRRLMAMQHSSETHLHSSRASEGTARMGSRMAGRVTDGVLSDLMAGAARDMPLEGDEDSSPVATAMRAGAAAGAGALRWPLSGVRGDRRAGVQHWGHMLGYSVPCADRRLSIRWLNLPEVRTALHAPPVDEHEWQPCSEHVHYHMVPISMIPLHKQALDQGLRVLIYSGDHDFIVPFTGTRAWVYSLNLTIARKYAPWMIDRQVAGFKVDFEEGLTFLTVKGAGHMVPQTNPERALHLILRYLNDSY